MEFSKFLREKKQKKGPFITEKGPVFFGIESFLWPFVMEGITVENLHRKKLAKKISLESSSLDVKPDGSFIMVVILGKR